MMASNKEKFSQFLKFFVLASSISAFLFVLSLKLADELIDKLWKKPSSFSGSDLTFWPPNLKFTIPNISADKSTKKAFYLSTDNLGALVERPRSNIQAWFFGDIGTADLWTNPKDRWTSLIEVSNLNFGFPKFAFSRLEMNLRDLFDKSEHKPKWIVLGDGLGLKYKNGFKLPDLRPFWIWGQPVTSHAFLEFLCFNLAPGLCISSISGLHPQLNTKPWLERQDPKDLSATLEASILEIETLALNLKKLDVGVIGLIFPFDPSGSLLLNERNSILRQRFFARSIQFIDIENCFLTNTSDGFFLDNGRRLSSEGHRVFAKCFDEGFRRFYDE